MIFLFCSHVTTRAAMSYARTHGIIPSSTNIILIFFFALAPYVRIYRIIFKESATRKSHRLIFLYEVPMVQLCLYYIGRGKLCQYNFSDYFPARQIVLLKIRNKSEN